MKAATSRIDLTAQPAEVLRESFEIKISDSEVLFWEKPIESERRADLSIPKYFFKKEVLNELEKINF
jgi:hypothetical protein